MRKAVRLPFLLALLALPVVLLLGFLLLWFFSPPREASSGAAQAGWVGHACEWSLDPSRESLVFIRDDGLTLRRLDRDHRVPFGGCVPSKKEFVRGVVALADGWRALVYGYGVEGGNFFESGRLVSPFACVVDFRDGSRRPLDPALLTDDLRQFKATVGARSGRLYVRSPTAIRAVDLERAAQVELARAGYLDTQTVIVETETAVRIVAATLEPIDLHHPIYRGRLEIRDFDPGSWPPELRETKVIAVGGRPDRLAVSPDGRWAAYDGRPYYVGIETGGEVSDCGLVDLVATRIEFELLSRPGSLEAADVFPAGDAAFVLVSEDRDPFESGGAREVFWLDRTGQRVGRTTWNPTGEMLWLPARRRVLGGDHCTLQLLDLPLPEVRRPVLDS